MKTLFNSAVLKKFYTLLKPLYGAKEEAVSGLCLHCVHRSLWRAGHCWSFGRELALKRPPVHLTTHTHTHKKKAHRFLRWTDCQSHTYLIFFLSRYVNTCCKFFSSKYQRRSKAKCVDQTVSYWPFRCLLSNQINAGPLPFICSDTQHLLSLAFRLWFALLSQRTSLSHITIFNR